MSIRLFPRTIYGLAIGFAVISGIITALLGIATLLFFHWELERQLDQRIAIESQALLDEYHDHGFATLVHAVAVRDRRSDMGDIGYLAEVAAPARTTAYIVTDSKGQRVAGSFDAAPPHAGWSEFVKFKKPDGSLGEAQALNSALAGGGNLIVAADRTLLFNMHRQILQMFGAGYVALLLLVAFTVFGFGRVVKQRLSSIETSALAIMGGDLSHRMPLDGSGGEFDRLSLVLNRMLDRISALLENLRQVSGDIAHDLRTPLTRIRTQLEGIENSLPDAPQRPLVTTAIGEMDDVLDLFSALLAISEIEGQSIRSLFAPVDLKDAVVEIVEAYIPAIDQAGMTMEIAGPPITVFGDRKLLQRCVANLLDNILTHTRRGTAIRITIENGDGDGDGDGQVFLNVADDGPGIPEADHERVFRRLTRLDRSRSTPGHGLGLNMVAAIASAHGGFTAIVPGASGLAVRVVLRS